MITSIEKNSIIQNFHIPRWNEIPDIDLYIDQVVTYVNSSFSQFSSHFNVPPLTRSMINNYVKAKIVNAPTGKKYSHLSVAMVIVVSIMKLVYSTEEIAKLIQLGLIIDEEHSLTYNRFCDAIEQATANVFSGSVSIIDEEIPGRDNKYLMDIFAISFAGKFYVQNMFLNNN